MTHVWVEVVKLDCVGSGLRILVVVFCATVGQDIKTARCKFTVGGQVCKM